MITIKNNFDIKNISFIHVGGRVKQYVELDDYRELNNFNKFISIGNTSKILFCFDYSPYIFIKYIKKKIYFFNDKFFAYSGISLFKLNEVLMKKNITGFEKISTIPGLLGGSIVNNASFLDQCISDLLIKILVYDNGKLYFIKKNDLELKYRSTNLIRNNFLIIGAYFYIRHDSNENIVKKFNLAKEYRILHQENKLSLGSTFKNTKNYKIGQVLDKLSYKGFSFSKKCYVSYKHANFIIIKKDANYKEIYYLINFLKNVLYNYLQEDIYLEIQVIFKDGRSNSN